MIAPIYYKSAPTAEELDELYYRGNGVSKRSYPNHFVGRTELLEDIGFALKSFSSSKSNVPRARVIAGAPGAGKTSLLRKISKDNASASVIPVFLDSARMSTPNEFVSSFISSLAFHNNEILISTKGIKLGRFQKSLHRKSKWEAARQSAIRHLLRGEGVWPVIADVLKINRGDSPTFVLMIDEAQDLSPVSGYEYNPIVRELHLGESGTRPLRVFPIFAGRLNTLKAITRVGISRFAYKSTVLGALSVTESIEAVTHFLKREDLGLPAVIAQDDRQLIAEAFALASEGWPRHLHCYMTAFAAKIASDFRDANPPHSLDFGEVLDEGHRSRIYYSSSRIKRASLPYAVSIALTRLAKQTPWNGSIAFRDILAASQDAAENPIDPNVLKYESLDEAERAGVLESEGTGESFKFPIPSLQTFVACAGNENETLEAMRKDLEDQVNRFRQNIANPNEE